MKYFPLILVEKDYWKGLIEWIKDTMLLNGFINKEDLDLIIMEDDLSKIMDIIKEFLKV
jgi:predicted Rossmann-fold nucleotide-binding protein